ncbi:MAG: succinate dehydrogenase/fumarate reductase iron-sulfur subunit [candidate division Zixibacteria bacterium]|nr:succinate dehydrogenase/fumarate reductase iron-sulfur subunit [candidate division Zixibacteria bacterium]
MNLTLRVWRQKNSQEKGHLETYQAKDINEDMSFLEMLDVVNEDLIKEGVEPIHFDHDCREGICGACSLVIGGIAHGGKKGCTTCELRMRNFKDGDTITVEPFRAKAFPVIRDLVVDRSSMDRVIQAGGFVSANTGGAPDANAIPVHKDVSDTSMDAAACIGCGACVAACKNASAMLFVSAKVSHLATLPQGQVERENRVRKMVAQMGAEGFGNCSNYYECEAVCPKEISVKNIAKMNREFFKANVSKK